MQKSVATTTHSHLLHEGLCIVGSLAVAGDILWHLAGWMHILGR